MIDREVKELEAAVEQIWDIATNKFGLDPFPVRFEIVPATVMYEIGSYALPGRYSHWTFGKAYHRMKMMYDFGLSKIYEVVINANPSYAFLLETNSVIQNKLVIAHVLGHVDFFKNNAYFSHTNRRMVDEAAMHARRMQEYEFQHGRKVVEELLDAVLSIEEHIDPDFFIRKQAAEREAERQRAEARREGRYDDLLSRDEREAQADKPRESPSRASRLAVPEKDIVYFIMQNSPVLEDWQRDVMSMIHSEMQYFVPQMQTKIMNEGWACATWDSLIPTEGGFFYFDELYESRKTLRVASGGARQADRITDFHKEVAVPTIRIRTRRGLTIEGSPKHRVLTEDGRWAFLGDLKEGDRVRIEVGAEVWPKKRQPLGYRPLKADTMMREVGELAGVSVSTVIRHLQGGRGPGAARVEMALSRAAYRPGNLHRVISTRRAFRVPEVLDEEIAFLLGAFIGDGKRTKSGVCLTTGDFEYAGQLAAIFENSFGLRAGVRWDAGDQGGRWRVEAHSRELLRLFASLGVGLNDKAREKKIPSAVLRSPREVMAAFLRGYFDADAYAGREGVRLSSASERLIREVQTVLLNYGILSTQRRHSKEVTGLEITDASAARFCEEIGFGLGRKREALREYVARHHWLKEEAADEIVAIEPGSADVYDITVERAHAYVANGLVHHNSFWHARIMREMDLPTSDHLEFAELHAGVVSPHRGQLNPYYLGYKIFEDIEKRWDNPSATERELFGRRGGEGREKIFEVRELDNDISFLRNYLTEELCEELDLFVYHLVDDEEWTVSEKQWEKVRDQLVANMTNFGFPYIEVVDGDYDRNRELYLRHRYEGVELDARYARKTLEHVYKLWGRDVHLETVVDEEPVVMHFDGKEHDED